MSLSSQGKKSANSLHIGKSLKIVNTRFLVLTFSNKACFLTIKTTVRFKLHTVYPLAANQLLVVEEQGRSHVCFF